MQLPAPPVTEIDAALAKMGFKPLGWLNWPKGTVVRFLGYPSGAYTKAYAWVLTGEHDLELDAWKGVWPD